MTPLRYEREKRHLSVAQVSRDVGVDHSQYSKIELARLRATPAVAERIAKYFGHAVTEMQILYPERYLSRPTAGTGEAA